MFHSLHANHQTQNSGGIPFLFLPTLQITRYFQWTNVDPYFPKMLQSQKTKDKIFNQTEFTMSRHLAAHNNNHITMTRTV